MPRVRLAVPLLALSLLCVPAAHARVPVPADTDEIVQSVTIHYRAHDGVRRKAIVLMPRDADPTRELPLIISPHGRGVDAASNARLWGDLPGLYDFVVVNPEGQGRKLGLYSWGFSGEIEDLARMPEIVARSVRRVHIDMGRIYAFGGSMGGQEALLLLARHPEILTGVAAFDPATDMAERYRAFGGMKDGEHLQQLARREIGGSPRRAPRAYAQRSPSHFVEQIATAGVPTQIWWSTRDRVIRNQSLHGAGLLFRQIKAFNPIAPVQECKGMWRHTVEMSWDRRLPNALGHFGLRAPPHSVVWGGRPLP